MNTIPQNIPQSNQPLQKQCSKCHIWQPFECFSRDRRNRDGLHSWCRTCLKELDKKRAWRKGNLRRVGLTPKQYDRMLEEQGGVCAVCHQPETRRRPWSNNEEINPLAVDHDHETGQVRALLCSHCNTSLGKLNEDPARIRALAEYAEWCQSLKANPRAKIIQLKLID